MKTATRMSYALFAAGAFALGHVVANPPVEPPITTPGIHYHYSDPYQQNLVGVESVECNRTRYFFYGVAGQYSTLNQAYNCPPPSDW